MSRKKPAPDLIRGEHRFPRRICATLRGEIMSQRIDLCSADEIAPGSAIKVETGELVLAVYNVEGEYFVTDDLCTHGPGSLSEGYIDGDVVECNFHNGQFNIKSGEVVAPPCMIPIKTYKTTVEGGRVFIETE
jgi:biphenyl 2,3-dioxygenase ferredoxin component